MTRNNREIGDTLEKKVAHLLQMNGTKNSGAMNDDADLKDDHIIIECKVKSKMAGVGIPEKLLDKVSEQALRWRRDWAIVNRNGDGDEYVTIPLKDFVQYYTTWRAMTEMVPI